MKGDMVIWSRFHIESMERAILGLLGSLQSDIEDLEKEVKKLQTKIDTLIEEVERLKRKP